MSTSQQSVIDGCEAWSKNDLIDARTHIRPENRASTVNHQLMVIAEPTSAWLTQLVCAERCRQGPVCYFSRPRTVSVMTSVIESDLQFVCQKVSQTTLSVCSPRCEWQFIALVNPETLEIDASALRGMSKGKAGQAVKRRLRRKKWPGGSQETISSGRDLCRFLLTTHSSNISLYPFTNRTVAGDRSPNEKHIIQTYLHFAQSESASPTKTYGVHASLCGLF
jgi:hypothetical protein